MTISRLTTYTAGSFIEPTIHNQEHDLFTNTCNTLEASIAAISAGTTPFTGQTTFEDSLLVNRIDRYSGTDGVYLEGVNLKDGVVQAVTVSARINAVATSTNIITTVAAHGLATGAAVTVRTRNSDSESGVLPSPLSAATTYFASIASSTTLKLHTTYANAVAGTSAVDLTTNGTGINEILGFPATRSAGQITSHVARNTPYYYNGTSDLQVATAKTGKYTISGLVPSYSAASAITIGLGSCSSSGGVEFIEVATAITLSLNVSGAGGRDTGSETSNSWWYPYLVWNKESRAVSGVLSTNATTPTLPSGYTHYRRLPAAIRNNASSDIIPFIVQNWPERPYFLWDVQFTAGSSPSNTTGVVNAASVASYTTASAASFAPPDSRLALLYVGADRISVVGVKEVSAGTERQLGFAAAGTLEDWVKLNSSQQFQYKSVSGSPQYAIAIKGFVITETL